jgi:hypothetical protein
MAYRQYQDVCTFPKFPNSGAFEVNHMKLIVIGQIGSDAGYWTFENGHWVHHGGWGIEALADVNRALSILGEAARLKTPGLADAVSRNLGEYVQKELTTHLGDQLKAGGVVIVNASAR